MEKGVKKDIILMKEINKSKVSSNFFKTQLFIQLIFIFITTILIIIFLNAQKEKNFFSYLLIYGASSILVVIRIGYSLYWGGKWSEESNIPFSKTPIFYFYLIPTLIMFVYASALIIFIGLSVEFPQFLNGSNFIIQILVLISVVILFFALFIGGIENAIFSFIIGINIIELYKPPLEVTFQTGIVLILICVVLTLILAPVYVFIPVIIGIFLQKRGFILENSKIKTGLSIGLTSIILFGLITIFHTVILYRLFIQA